MKHKLMRDRPFIDSKILNDQTYIYWYDRLSELAINTFEWKNLPPTIDPRFLEVTLYTDGLAVFFKDTDLDSRYFLPKLKDSFTYLCTQCRIGGTLDIYRIPIDRYAFAMNGYNKNLDSRNSVLIFNNYLRTNCLRDIQLFAQRLYEIERTIDVNVHGQKTPKLIRTTENQRLTLQNFMNQVEGNQNGIYVDKNFDINSVEPIDISTPYVSDKLETLKHQIFNEALTYLGIENTNTDKRERMVTDEVSSNLGAVSAQRNNRLNARKDACKLINEMFGLNIDVNYRRDLISQILTPSRQTEEDDNNE